jgi:hypothetical protein
MIAYDYAGALVRWCVCFLFLCSIVLCVLVRCCSVDVSLGFPLSVFVVVVELNMRMPCSPIRSLV